MEGLGTIYDWEVQAAGKRDGYSSLSSTEPITPNTRMKNIYKNAYSYLCFLR